jgi:hypothetical protein
VLYFSVDNCVSFILGRGIVVCEGVITSSYRIVCKQTTRACCTQWCKTQRRAGKYFAWNMVRAGLGLFCCTIPMVFIPSYGRRKGAGNGAQTRCTRCASVIDYPRELQNIASYLVDKKQKYGNKNI